MTINHSGNHNANAHIGARIRDRRIMLGYLQRELAIMLGVSSATLGGYETGRTAIAAATLFMFAQTLRVPITYFFDGLIDETAKGVGLHEQRTLQLARAYGQLPERVQPALSRFVRELVEGG